MPLLLDVKSLGGHGVSFTDVTYGIYCMAQAWKRHCHLRDAIEENPLTKTK